MNFKSKIVWITGASSGIGEALAHEFAREDSILILSGRNTEALNATAKICMELGAAEQPMILPFDLGDHAQIPQIVQKALAHKGHVDILINNAGVGQRGKALDVKPDVVRQIINVNFLGPVFLTQALLPSMLERKSGTVVVVSSVLGKFHLPGRSGYVASKHALQGYFNTLRAELRNSGIKITVICPGWITTRISENALTPAGQPNNKQTRPSSEKMSAETCAKKMLKAIASGKREALIGGKEIWGGVLHSIAPSIYDQIVSQVSTEFIYKA